MRRLFGPKRDEVTRDGENYIMSSLMICTPHPVLFGDKMLKNEMGGACSTYGSEERRIQDLVEKPEVKRPLWRHRHRWEDNIKMDLQGVVCGGMDCFKLAPDRDRWQALVNVIVNLQVP